MDIRFLYRGPKRRRGAALLLLPAAIALGAEDDARQGEAECAGGARYTFSWSLQEECALEPRGGTTRGAALTLDPEPHPGWTALQEEGLSDFERDRRAILAMAGPYRASFEFLETVGYTPDFERARPYHSWGTEYIHVVEDREDFISLQHIMVMFLETEEGEIRGPFVQKHWRQDWHYEKPQVMTYAGANTWVDREVPEEELEGSWAQSVYQVDDSPRYESWGRWEHHANMSTWRSARTWRPLPRRESSVRDDYDVLVGWNEHSIVPNGWVHEEENYKVRLDGVMEVGENLPYLAKEQGVNRYRRITDFDWSAGDEYWEETSSYWEDVREVWQDFFDAGERISIESSREGVPLFAVLFEGAEQARAGEAPGKPEIRERIAPYVEVPRQ